MKERSLILMGLAAGICSAVLLLYVVFKIDASQRHITWVNDEYGLGMFNYNNQNAYTIFRLSNALNTYKNNRGSPDSDELKADYIQKFDILWSAFVSLKQFDKYASMPELDELRAIADSSMKQLDTMVRDDVELNDEQIDFVTSTIIELGKLNTKLGNAHFTRYSKTSDQVNRSIEQLSKLAENSLITLLLSISIIGFLFWRLRKRDQQQAHQLATAHQQLTVLVEDLRSGQAERRSRNQFLAAVSHDLRQPLHALGFFLNSLEKNITTVDGTKLLEKIRSSTTALNGLCNSLLDISRLDAGVVEVDSQHVPITELFKLLKEEHQNAAAENNVELQVEYVELYVISDRLHLLRILRNLVENAILHAPDSTVTLQAKSIDGTASSTHATTLPSSGDATADFSIGENSKYVEISVRDTGPGIPLAEREVVFSEYYQLKNPERDRNKGLGLGLSIVKRLSDLLGHQISLSDDQGNGTVFTLYLPQGQRRLCAEHSRNNVPEIFAQLDLDGLQIMVIDDEADIRDGMEITLTDVGCRVFTCESAASAQSLLVELDLIPDLIIADYRLREGKTGSEAVELLRDELNQDIPAFLISGDTSAIRVKEASDSGIRLLHKPVTPTELFEVINEVAYEKMEA